MVAEDAQVGPSDSSDKPTLTCHSSPIGPSSTNSLAWLVELPAPESSSGVLSGPRIPTWALLAAAMAFTFAIYFAWLIASISDPGREAGG